MGRNWNSNFPEALTARFSVSYLSANNPLSRVNGENHFPISLNHPNFDQPVGDLCNSQFGTIIRSVGTPTSMFGSLLGGDSSPRRPPDQSPTSLLAWPSVKYNSRPGFFRAAFSLQNVRKKAPEDSGATRVTREMRASESGKS